MTTERRFKWSHLQAVVSGVRPSIIAISLLVTGLVAGGKQLGMLQSAELLAYDQMVRSQPDKGIDSRLLIVALTESDINQNQWPLKDETLAKLIRNLQVHQPKVIGLDMYRNIPQPPGHQELLQQLQAPNVITIEKLRDPNGDGVPAIPGLPIERIGFNDLVHDPDNVIRRNFLFTSAERTDLYSFSLRISLQYLDEREYPFKADDHALYIGNTTFTALDPTSGGYQKIDNSGYQILLAYRSRHQVAPQVSVTQVLNQDFDPALVRGKIVLIGSTAPSLKDLFTTPYSAADRENTDMATGVTIHAQLISQILSTVLDGQPLFWFWPQWAELLWMWGWALVGGILVWRLQHPVALGLVTIVALGSLGCLSFIIFTRSGWVPVVAPALTLMITGAGVVAYKLLYNAFHDALSGLPNRAFFLQRLHWMIRHSRRAGKHLVEGTIERDGQQAQASMLAVVLIGLDRFKAINDSMGHQAGDQLLIKASQRLKACLPKSTLLARVGGDEFAVALPGVQDATELPHLIEQITEEMTIPFLIQRQEIFTSASMGIALNPMGQDCKADDLLRDAHTAMYRAKAAGKSRHEVFAVGMRTQIVRRLQLETELHRALEQQEFQLHYQPIVVLKSGRVTGFEALLRWPHPQEGFIPPSEFIPVAEEIGLIVPLGQWIIHAACNQISLWQAQFQPNPPLVVSVNLSSQQFTQPGLVEHVEQTLRSTGLDGCSLKLEITESMAMSDIEATIVLLQRLKALNVRLSLDDFGTGYSSLSHLHRLPIDTLKVDRSFVNQIDATGDAAIVQTIIVLGHTLGMDVVAEGIETAIQRDRLERLNCEYGQGYFFAKPLSNTAAAVLLEQDIRFTSVPSI
ncbi:diguanylate cyclase [Leptolyngbya sp. 'hensonii']|uniref:EAL domain-containing protein n=1 Tax=Leptolyngbya sp. 'hensonii' TaxID=1922337 RepID=UPI00094F8D7C|nr:EAL domain-containing protein [Leptolyngbya sp. 'hensonii']OLP19484.1 diguanylate cyclase [Leptolyngbya sp. 'hensonii']